VTGVLITRDSYVTVDVFGAPANSQAGSFSKVQGHGPGDVVSFEVISIQTQLKWGRLSDQ
jgi:hypothetical protein